MPSPYAFRLALQSLRKDFWINLLSVLTIAAGLVIISVGGVVFYNVDLATRKLPERFTVIVYLDQSASREQIDQVNTSLKANPAVLSTTFISKEEALRGLKATLKNSDYVLEGIDENPLPDSFEVKLRREAIKAESAKSLAAEIRKMKGVGDVDYGEKFLSALHNLKTGVKVSGIVLAIVLSTGIVFVCYSTVKILFYRRTEEIETFKLLGATKGFIRAPFLIEGGVIGLAGGAAGLLAMYAFSTVVMAQVVRTMPIFASVIFPWNSLAFLPAVGLFLGVSGAAIALGRLKF